MMEAAILVMQSNGLKLVSFSVENFGGNLVRDGRGSPGLALELFNDFQFFIEH